MAEDRTIMFGVLGILAIVAIAAIFGFMKQPVTYAPARTPASEAPMVITVPTASDAVEDFAAQRYYDFICRTYRRNGTNTTRCWIDDR